MIRFCISILAMTLLAQDASTPKNAAKSLYDAVNRADEASLVEHFYASDPAQRKLAGAYARFVIQGKRLGDVLKEKFPAAEIPIDTIIKATDLQKLDEAPVEQTEDLATIKLAGKSKPLQFRRSDGRWQLVILDTGDASNEGVLQQAAIITDFAEAFSRTADEIAADKFATPRDAESALQTRVNLVLTKAVQNAPPTTRGASTTQSAK